MMNRSLKDGLRKSKMEQSQRMQLNARDIFKHSRKNKKISDFDGPNITDVLDHFDSRSTELKSRLFNNKKKFNGTKFISLKNGEELGISESPFSDVSNFDVDNFSCIISPESLVGEVGDNTYNTYNTAPSDYLDTRKDLYKLPLVHGSFKVFVWVNSVQERKDFNRLIQDHLQTVLNKMCFSTNEKRVQYPSQESYQMSAEQVVALYYAVFWNADLGNYYPLFIETYGGKFDSHDDNSIITRLHNLHEAGVAYWSDTWFDIDLSIKIEKYRLLTIDIDVGKIYTLNSDSFKNEEDEFTFLEGLPILSDNDNFTPSASDYCYVLIKIPNAGRRHARFYPLLQGISQIKECNGGGFSFPYENAKYIVYLQAPKNFVKGISTISGMWSTKPIMQSSIQNHLNRTLLSYVDDMRSMPITIASKFSTIRCEAVFKELDGNLLG